MKNDLIGFIDAVDNINESEADRARRGVRLEVMGYGPRTPSGEPLRIHIEVPATLEGWQAQCDRVYAQQRQLESDFLERQKHNPAFWTREKVAPIKRPVGRPRLHPRPVEDNSEPVTRRVDTDSNPQGDDQHLLNLLMQQIRDSDARGSRPISHESDKLQKEARVLRDVEQHNEESESQGPPKVIVSW